MSPKKERRNGWGKPSHQELVITSPMVVATVRQPESLWARRITLIHCSTTDPNSPKIWTKQGSFFWSHLMKIRPLFTWSTRWNIGTGATISFWYDSWTFPTIAPELQPTHAVRSWSLQQAPNQGFIINTQLSTGQDKLIWLWSTSGEYSAKSFYDVVVEGGRTEWEFQFTWRLPIPPTVRVFAYLWLKGKILTHDVMFRRKLQCEMRCFTCNNCELETSLHLFFQCDFAQRLWRRMTLLLRYRMVLVRDSIKNTFVSSLILGRNRFSKTKWGVYFLAGCWIMWKEHNSLIFQGKIRDLGMAAEFAVR